MTIKEHDILLGALLDHISLGIAVKDADHDFRFVLCNQAFAETVGRPLEEIIGKTDSELAFTVFSADVCGRHDRRVIRTQKPFESVERTTGGFDTRKIFRVLKFPLQLPNGQTLLVGTFMDITRLQNLIESEQNMSAILAKSVLESNVDECFSMIAETLFTQLECDGVAVIEYTMVGQYTLKYETFRQGVKAFAELLPQQVHALFAACTPRFSTGHQKLIVDTSTQHYFDVWKKVGMASALITPIRLERHLWGIVVAGFSKARSNFTAIDRRIMMSMSNILALQMMRSRQNEALRKAQRMEAIGLMASWVAHDFNNMVQTILGHTEMAMQEVPAGSPVRENLDFIYQAAERSIGIVHQLLTFARQDRIRPVVVDLNCVIQDLLRLLTKLASGSGEFQFVPHAEACWICMDVAQITQVLTNLVVNARDAIQATGVHGVVTLTTQITPVDDPVLCNGASAGTYVKMRVSDTGCGMSEQVRQRIFDPFFTTKPEGKGTGLGLSAVHGILLQNKGFVAVESQENRGTTFSLYFPYHAPNDVAACAL